MVKKYSSIENIIKENQIDQITSEKLGLIEKIRKIHLGRKQTSQEKETRRQSCTGLICWNNGEENKRSKTCPSEGWTKGMILKEKKYCWTNGEKNKRSTNCPGPGWYKGFITSLSKNKKEKIWWTNRKAMYGKYYYMFMSHSPNNPYIRGNTNNRVL